MLNSVMLSFSSWACGALLVNQMDGYSGMGIYTAIKRVQQVPELLLGMLMAPFIPVLSEAFGRKDTATYRRTLLVGFSMAALLMIPVSLLQLSAPWLTVLPYGKTYGSGESVVRWVMVGSIAYGLLWPLGAVIVTVGRMWMAFWLILINTALLLGLGWVLVPKWGAAGYATAWTIAFVISNVPCVAFLYSRFRGVMSDFHWAAMLTLAALLSGASWLVGRNSGPLASLCVGIVLASCFVAWRVWIHPFRNQRRGLRSPEPFASTRNAIDAH
jgi:O-antigen/teichoic acid export membrane protein